MLKLLRKLDSSTVDLARDLLGRHRRLVIAALVGNLLAAVLEGGTMAILALALQTLVGRGEVALADDYGRLGELADAWRTGLGIDQFFGVLLGLAVVSQLLRGGLRFAADYVAGRLQAEVEAHVRTQLFERFMSLGLASVRQSKLGDLASYSDQAQYLGRAIHRANIALAQSLLLVAYGVVLVWLSPVGSAVTAVAAVVVAVGLRPVMRRIRAAGDRYKNATVRLNERTVELLGGLRLIVSLGREERAKGVAGEAIDEAAEATRSAVTWQALLSPLVDSLTIVGLSAVLAGGFFVLDRTDAGLVSGFVTFLLILFRSLPRFSIVNKNLANISYFLPFVQRIAEFLGRPVPAPRAAGTSRPFTGIERVIELEGVSLRYPARESWALKRVDLTLERGQTVAIVGTSGSGKTSLTDLLLKLIEPTAGRILVDGVDLAELDDRAWKCRIAVVSQKPFLFHATIAENIAFARENATRREIERASEAAQAYEFISELPNGYDTLVGDRGFSLSGGQQQRIAIAQAILRDPDLLLLDEVTSGLDSETERALVRSVLDLAGRRIVVMVTHRLASVRQFSNLVVLDRGRVVERGRHSELLERGGRYAELWRAQESEVATPEDPLSPT